MSQNLFLCNFHPLASILSSAGSWRPDKIPSLKVQSPAMTLALTLELCDLGQVIY